MKHVDERRLQCDLTYRLDYLIGVVGFGTEDVQAVRAVAPHLEPLIPLFVEGFYNKLLESDATRRHLLLPQTGYQGKMPARPEDLHAEHEIVVFRKTRLAAYLKQLFGGSFNRQTLDYFDRLGSLHADPGATLSRVSLVHMEAMLAFLSDAILSTVLRLGIDSDTRVRAARAFNKVFWLQNDLITRHYVP